MVALDPILASSKFRGIPKLVICHFCRGEYMNSAAFMDRTVLSDIMYSLDSICTCQFFMKLHKPILGLSGEKSGEIPKLITSSCKNSTVINGEYLNSTAIIENQPLSDNVDGQEKSKQISS